MRQLVSEGGINWPRLNLLAVACRAAPVLWSQLQHQPPDLIPADSRAHLRQFAMVTALRMSHLEDRMWQTFAALGGAGIDAIILKGAALGLDVYGSFYDRPMSDLDVLVTPPDAACRT